MPNRLRTNSRMRPTPPHIAYTTKDAPIWRRRPLTVRRALGSAPSTSPLNSPHPPTLQPSSHNFSSLDAGLLLPSLMLARSDPPRSNPALPCPVSAIWLPPMTDTVDRNTRSRMMASVSSKDTAPELALRRALHALGLRYRLHCRNLPGTPDLTFPRFRAVCFVHGCFWHRHPRCHRTTDPTTRPEFWHAKFQANVERDQRARQQLLAAGWRVAIIWECALRKDRAERTSHVVAQWLHGDDREFETPLFETRHQQ